MLERMRDCLSLYHRHIQRLIDSPYRENRRELSTALSFIYTDVLDFCQQATTLFIKKRLSGQRYAPSHYYMILTLTLGVCLGLQSLRTISSMLWQPFDTRFKGIIERFSLHQKLFEGELNLHDQQMLVRHFQRFEIKEEKDSRTRERVRRKEKHMSERRRRQKEHRKMQKKSRLVERNKDIISRI